MIKAVIFDMDGTLINSEIIWHKAWLMVNKEFSLNLDEKQLLSFIGMPKQTYDSMIHQLIPDVMLRELLHKLRLIYFENYVYINGIEVKEGVIELLEYLKKKNICFAICTSTFKERTLFMLEKTNLLKYFDLIITGDGLIHGKPDPEIYLKTLKSLNLNADECIAIEDSALGIRSATSAGIKTYFVKDINDISEDVEMLIEKKLNTIDEIIKEKGGIL